MNKHILLFVARRRAAAKRKKLKNLGKSKSTDTEEEDCDDDCADDGKYFALGIIYKNISNFAKNTHNILCNDSLGKGRPIRIYSHNMLLCVQSVIIDQIGLQKHFNLYQKKCQYNEKCCS